MTHHGGQPHEVGDRGQRFEVSVYSSSLGRRLVCLWTNDAEDADKCAKSLALRPGWSDGKVLDRLTPIETES